MIRVAARAVLGLVVLVVAVNLVWFVAPILGSPGVYRPLFVVVLVVVASAAWRQMRGDG